MVQIRKRWPILTALGIAITYGANNYQLAGIENLRLEPRANRTASSNPNAGFDMSEFGRQLQNDRFFGQTGQDNSAFANIPPWEDMLSVAEKFAIWEDRSKTPAATPPPTRNDLSLPGALPIPLPGNLPSTSFQANAPNAFAAAQPANDMAANNWATNQLLAKRLPSTGASNTPGSFAQDLTAAFPGMTTPRDASGQPITSQPHNDFSRSVPSGSLIQKPVARAADFFGTAATNSTSTNRMRIASFNLGGFGPAKMAKPHVMELLVSILRQYDVIALQSVQSTRDDVLPMIVERLNQSGRSYDYLVGPRVGRDGQREQFAFVFDTSRLETDRFQLYTVDDPEEIMTFDPLVAWFRCKGVAAENAFTFSLVNMHIDPAVAYQEQALLPNLINAIESDGRNEDDWILLGDFAGSTSALTSLHSDAVRFAIQDIPTDVAGERMLDTILFSSRGTAEFTGRSGAFDFLRKHNLSLESALEVSSHMPVWAEFSTIEGAEPGRIAPVDSDRVF